MAVSCFVYNCSRSINSRKFSTLAAPGDAWALPENHPLDKYDDENDGDDIGIDDVSLTTETRSSSQ